LNGFTLLVVIVLVAGIPLAFRAGMLRERRDARARGGAPWVRAAERDDARADADAAAATAAVARGTPSAVPAPMALRSPAPATTATAASPDASAAWLLAERARLIRAAEREAASLRAARSGDAADIGQLREFADERRALLRDLAAARGETARYREIVVDLEDNAPPPLLGGAGAPDDLKLIVGVGPVLERMLHRMGIGSYREIARWSEHDVDAVDARLPEFHGRIRRDAWVTQARALHQSKYGERP
jgi:predicted flap endonuclease-1-like 5' DNA nuclease